MIKVMHIISDTNIGGAGKVVENYLASCDRTRFDVSVALPRGSLLVPVLRAAGARLYETDGIRDRSFDLAAVSALRRIILKEDPDIVHTHGAFSGRIAARQCRKKIVVTRHSAFPLPERVKRTPFRQLYKYLNEKYADLIIAVSPVCRDYILEAGVSPEKTAVLLNGVEPAPPVPQERVLAMKRRIGAPDGVFTAGIVARLEPYKGHAYVLEAVKDIRASGRDICVIAAGTGSLLDSLREKAKEDGLADAVLFPGFLEDTAALWPLLDAQINASYVEATSLALLEGMSAGVPAVVSDCGGNPTIVEDGVSGLVFPMHDSRRLAECLCELIDDPERAREMGLKAREAYERNYTAAAFARKLEAYYTALTGGKDGE
ncbi:MAG: glycosyltransferase family 4 protein [Oscillospiraceae bacterium]|nr:glycosyltransferase family 4 protein [Oscillospiraceae bacterium]